MLKYCIFHTAYSSHLNFLFYICSVKFLNNAIMKQFIDDPLDVVSSKPDFSNMGLQPVSLESTSMSEIFVLFICEVQDDVLSLSSAHSYYSSRDYAFFKHMSSALDFINSNFR